MQDHKPFNDRDRNQPIPVQRQQPHEKIQGIESASLSLSNKRSSSVRVVIPKWETGLMQNGGNVLRPRVGLKCAVQIGEYRVFTGKDQLPEYADGEEQKEGNISQVWFLSS